MNSSLSDLFCFKEFSLKIVEGVFPVTTDSVLLGSWIDSNEAKTIIDLGCGSGILSLMLAQKSKIVSKILAVDIDEGSVICASTNIKNSPWKDLVSCFQIDLREIVSIEPFSKMKSSIDLIVSNPPYFHKQLVSQEDHKSRSRHQLQIDFEMLAKLADFFLSDNGKACFVIPIMNEDELTFQMYIHKFQLNRIAKIKHKANSPYSLFLLEYSKMQFGLKQEEIILHTLDEDRTAEFYELTKDFYI